MALKFEDDEHETVFRSVEWSPTRSGEISAVAIFDPVEIDGCEVSRATLHNLTFIKELELAAGCRILVSKRNMIIPHIEDNLDRGNFSAAIFPVSCPCCGGATRIQISKGKDSGGNERDIETLYCDNPDCSSQRLRKFVHFAGKKAMNIDGLSKATLEQFIERGWIDTFMDIYHLDRYRNEIVQTAGFGEKSFDRLWEAVQASRNTTFERYLISMDIPMIGRTASGELCRQYDGSLDAFEAAVDSGFDFTQLPDFGSTLHQNIHEWFGKEENRVLWKELQQEMNIQDTSATRDAAASGSSDHVFAGKTIVATGKFVFRGEHLSRDTINAKVVSFGATAGSSVTKKTDYLVVGENAGSKLDKARDLGVVILSVQEFFEMAGEA
jgi:DNA ligase (NAD+)